jgi:predicted phosphodiesterase
MSTSKRLTQVFQSAPEIHFDDRSKFILFSDCHRGDNSWADDFANNQTLFFHALKHYYHQGFTYIEIGDGDELWENSSFANIRRAHSHVFWLLRKFYIQDRFHLIWGNHDMERKDPETVKRTLYRFRNERTGEYEPLFEGIQPREGLVLRHVDTGVKVFLVHGHQGGLLNDRWWRLSRFFVRYLWRHVQLLGVKDPTSPAQNLKKRNEVERKITQWVEANHHILIAGHTHQPRFPAQGAPPYFNTGSCVHPRCVTGIEIQDGEIALIKWWVKPDAAGMLHVAREVLVGPEKLQAVSPGN